MIFCDEKFSRTGKSITYFIVVSCPKSTGMEILIFHGLEGGLRDGDVDFSLVF